MVVAVCKNLLISVLGELSHHPTFRSCWSASGTVCRSPSVGTDRRTVSPTDWIIRTGNSIVAARSRLWEAPSCSAAALLNLILSEEIVHVRLVILDHGSSLESDGILGQLLGVLGEPMEKSSLVLAISKLAAAGEQAGFTVEQMIGLLDAGLEVNTLLELICWRLNGVPLSPVPRTSSSH